MGVLDELLKITNRNVGGSAPTTSWSDVADAANRNVPRTAIASPAPKVADPYSAIESVRANRGSSVNPSPAPELQSHTLSTAVPPSTPSKGIVSPSGMNDTQIAAGIKEDATKTRYSGEAVRPTAINSSNSYTDGDLPDTGQSVSGITSREELAAGQDSILRDINGRQATDDAMRASNIRYQAMNSIASMIQDIQNRMGGNYGNRMDQALTPEQGGKAIQGLSSMMAGIGSTNKEYTDVQKEDAAMTAANSHAADRSEQYAIQREKLAEENRHNLAAEKNATDALGLTNLYHMADINAKNTRTGVMYENNLNSREASKRNVELKARQKAIEDVDKNRDSDEMAMRRYLRSDKGKAEYKGESEDSVLRRMREEMINRRIEKFRPEEDLPGGYNQQVNDDFRTY